MWCGVPQGYTYGPNNGLLSNHEDIYNIILSFVAFAAGYSC